jgi:hypothetical protein
MGSALATLDLRMDRVTLSAPAEDDFHTLVRLIVGGIGSRSRLSYEQTTELQLAVEALVANRSTTAGTVVLEAGIEGPEIDGHKVTVLVGPFVAAANEAGARPAIEKLVDEVRLVPADGGGEWIELTVAAAGRTEGP